MEKCRECGYPKWLHDRDVTFKFPDVVASMSDEELVDRVQTFERTLVAVDSERFFLKCLMPIRLVGGHEIVAGVWVEVDRPVIVELQSDKQSGDAAGKLGNTIPFWPDGHLGSNVLLRNLVAGEHPYIVGSAEPQFANLLERDWDHAAVLARLPSK